jgi:hypothetical protein
LGNKARRWNSIPPILPIQAAVVDGFGQVFHFDVFTAGQIGYGAAYF